VLTAVAGKGLLGDAVEQLRAGEVGESDACDGQPAELCGTRMLPIIGGHCLLILSDHAIW
jgi:hypothetical protein